MADADDDARARRRKRAADSCDKPEGEKRPAPAIKPMKKKVGEDKDNLRRRAEWFRRRTE